MLICSNHGTQGKTRALVSGQFSNLTAHLSVPQATDVHDAVRLLKHAAHACTLLANQQAQVWIAIQDASMAEVNFS